MPAVIGADRRLGGKRRAAIRRWFLPGMPYGSPEPPDSGYYISRRTESFRFFCLIPTASSYHSFFRSATLFFCGPFTEIMRAVKIRS